MNDKFKIGDIAVIIAKNCFSISKEFLVIGREVEIIENERFDLTIDECIIRCRYNNFSQLIDVNCLKLIGSEYIIKGV